MLIGVEWTSAAFAAELIDTAGRPLDHVREPVGVTAVAAGSFALRFAELIPEGWWNSARHAYLSGMVTGRGGWVETAFCSSPAGPVDLLARAIKVQDGDKRLIFLPGVSSDEALPDVMRGEELKALAVAAGQPAAIVVLPGPHTKYVGVENGRITGLATYMGGEAGNLLRRDSLISRLIPEDRAVSEAGFARGLQTAWNGALPGGILRRLFSARSLVLFEKMAAHDIAGYIAGLVVGAEICEARQEWPLDQRPLLVIGTSEEARRYRDALGAAGFAAVSATAETSSVFAALHRELLQPIPS